MIFAKFDSIACLDGSLRYMVTVTQFWALLLQPILRGHAAGIRAQQPVLILVRSEVTKTRHD